MIGGRLAIKPPLSVVGVTRDEDELSQIFKVEREEDGLENFMGGGFRSCLGLN